MRRGSDSNWRCMPLYLATQIHPLKAGFPTKKRWFACQVRQLIVGGALMLITLSLMAKPQTEQPPLVLGVHPYRSAVTLMKGYKPLAAYLSRKTGRPHYYRQDCQ